MEWVETTGKSIEEAKDRALDLLGVDERDAEFEVVEEAKVGFLGRMKNPARVRARVRPAAPRAKTERRDRRKRSDEPRASRSRQRGGKTSNDAADQEQGTNTDLEDAVSEADGSPRAGEVQPDAGAAGAGGDETSAAPARQGERSGSSNRRRRGRRGGGSGTSSEKQAQTQAASTQDDKGTAMTELSLAEQGRVVSEFLDGLVAAFGLEATTSWEEVDEDNVEVRVDGTNLGLLVGPKGRTLQAVTDVARSVVVRHADGISPGRVHIDVAGYRQRRREALARFTRDVVQQVLDSGTARALEPMSPADRKVVHDTVNELDGVVSTSEGEEPNRRVVINPE